MLLWSLHLWCPSASTVYQTPTVCTSGVTPSRDSSPWKGGFSLGRQLGETPMGSSRTQSHCQHLQTFCRWQAVLGNGRRSWSPSTAQKHTEATAAAPPGCSGQMQDGFLGCCTSAFPASSQHHGMEGSSKFLHGDQ